MERTTKRYLATAFILLALAVILGAFGAHALKERLSAHYLEVWETANRYHFIHALGIVLLCVVFMRNEKSLHLTRIFVFMILGIIFFSGSLYLLSLNQLLDMPSLKIMGAITPIGGVFFVLGWLDAAKAILQKS